tara:strand:+ start:324 stop:2465 length:2142 start_codon:yes stop_codon:yes gene_type:complete
MAQTNAEKIEKIDEAIVLLYGDGNPSQENLEKIKILSQEKKSLQSQPNITQAVEPQPQTFADQAADFGKSVGSGVAKGVSYLAGLPGDITELGNQFLPEFLTKPIFRIDRSGIDFSPEGETTKIFPTSKDVQNFVSDAIPQAENVFGYEPTTGAGRYAQTIAEFATPGIAGKTSAARKFGTGLGGTTGSIFQGVEDLSGSQGVAATVTIPTSILLGALAGPSTAARLAEKSMRTVTPDDIAKGIDLQNIGKQKNIKLLPGETIDDKILQDTVEAIVKSEGGSPFIYQGLKGREEAVKKFVKEQADAIDTSPESIRNLLKSIQESSSKTIQSAKNVRTSKSNQAGYGVANTEFLEPNQVMPIIQQIDDAIRGLPKSSPNATKLRQLKNQLIKRKKKVKGKRNLEIVPETNINKLDSTFKFFRDSYRTSKQGQPLEPGRSIDTELGNLLFNVDESGILNNLDKAMKTNVNYAKGNAVYQELSNTLVNVVIDNLDQLSKKGLTLSKIESFIFNPSKASVQDINNTLATLNKTNPQATIDIANIYFRNALNRAFPVSKRGEDLTAGFKLVKSIMGTGEQRKNFMAVIENVAKAKNVNPQNLKVGFENMLRVLKRTGKISSINKPGFDVTNAASRSILKDVAMMKTFNPLVRLSTKYGEMKAGGAEKILGAIFASDDAIENLILLSKTNPNSKIAINRTLQVVNASQQLNNPDNINNE